MKPLFLGYVAFFGLLIFGIVTIADKLADKLQSVVR